MIGSQILNYQVKSLLGEGGMGAVYLAEHVKLGRKVAIKVLHAHLASNESIRNRFMNEAKTMAELQHPNIVSLLDYHEDQFGLYLIMEFIDGKPLDEYIENVSGPIPEEDAIPLFKQALAAFQYAHDKKVVHRDIKPSNLIITSDGTLKVLDFGIAKIVGNDNYKLTKTGAHTGSVYYMSPEQVRGIDVDFRTDIYSLGITLYQMLTGYNPYVDLTTEYDIFEKIVKVPLADPRTKYPAVSEHMCKVIDKSTQKNPLERFNSCNEFSKNLDHYDAEQIVSNASYSESRNNSEASYNNSQPVKEETKKNVLFFIIPAVLILAGFVGWYIYNSYQNKSNSTENNTSTLADFDSSLIKTEKNDTPVISVSQEPPKDSVIIKTNQPAPPVTNTSNNGIIKLRVSAKSLQELSDKLAKESGNIMKNKGYNPEDLNFDPVNHIFTCNMVPGPSEYVKIRLAFGDINNGGCEARDNVLNRNPGSDAVIKTSDANYIYNVILVHP